VPDSRCVVDYEGQAILSGPLGHLDSAALPPLDIGRLARSMGPRRGRKHSERYDDRVLRRDGEHGGRSSERC
jgi:hypothetical protein